MTNINIAAVVLAAGIGQRFKSQTPKLLQNFQDKPLLCHILNKYLQLQELQQIIIVIGHKHNDILTTINKHFSKDQQQKFTIAHNQNYQKGMLSSVMLGLQNTNQNITHILMTPADMPNIKINTLKQIADAPNTDTQTQNRLCYVPLINQNVGNPVLLSRNIIPILKQQINNLPPETGAISAIKQIIQNNPNQVKFININDKGALNDIDTIDDLKQLQSKT